MEKLCLEGLQTITKEFDVVCGKLKMVLKLDVYPEFYRFHTINFERISGTKCDIPNFIKKSFESAICFEYVFFAEDSKEGFKSIMNNLYCPHCSSCSHYNSCGRAIYSTLEKYFKDL